MFGSEVPTDSLLMPIFNFRKKIFDSAKQLGKILNPFGRPIFYKNEEEHVFFRNFITSCKTDYIFKTIIELDGIKNIKSKLLFPYHDALVFQIHNSETNLIKEIKSIMERCIL